jgi:hypothetical protein
VVHDEDVELAQRVGGRCQEVLGRRRIGEVELGERRVQLASDRLGASGLRSPVLRRIVLRPALDENCRAGLAQATRDRVADPDTAADTRDERAPAAELEARLRR